MRTHTLPPLLFVCLLAVCLPGMSASETAIEPVPFTITLDTPVVHDDGEFLWFHPRATSIPQGGEDGNPAVLMTLQKHLQVSDFYSGLYMMRTNDLGETWTGPTEIPELAWRDGPNGTILAVCDVTPGYHPIMGKVLAIGAQLYYRPDGSLPDGIDRSDQTAYTVYDPETNRWTGWRTLEMPDDRKFDFSRNACAQWLIEPNGDLLLPLYIGPDAGTDFTVTVARCSFDGDELVFKEHGAEMTVAGGRGLCEPSLARFDDRYFLTLRNDARGYVTSGTDGLHYDPILPWRFDDGEELGSYNTQQHWLVHQDGLFLTYTRRGADNDHVFRHRAPLFMARVNPDTLEVMRDTERVLVPERGATLGNFGAAAIDEHESWVTVGEGVWNDDMRARGATGALYVARVRWATPNTTVRFPYPSLSARLVMTDVNLNEAETLTLSDGGSAEVELLELVETRDPIRNAMRRADLRVRVNGEETTLTSGLYNRPVAVGGMLVDSPVTGGYNIGSGDDRWSLEQDARLRVWPGGGPLTGTDTFVYPIDQVWHGSTTWFDNEPVDGGAQVSETVYYHSGIDIGGVEGRTRVLAAADALVVSARGDVLSGFTEDTPMKPRYDVVYLYDARGWFYRYSHFDSIDDAIRIGDYLSKGTYLGRVGKEGASGGWAHLHFEIKCRQPSGGWGTLTAHPLIREAYIREYRPEILACARQRHLILPGDTVILDGGNSWSAAGDITDFAWRFTDGATGSGMRVERTYHEPGRFEEVLKVTDVAGHVDYDFATVQVLDPSRPDRYTPSLHAAYHPTFDLKPDRTITFSVRAFRFIAGEEHWDFGDGSPVKKTRSSQDTAPRAPEGYSFIEHAYEHPGDYIVIVQRADADGMQARTHLHVRVDEP